MITITNYCYDYEGVRYWFASQKEALQFMRICHQELYERYVLPAQVIKEVKKELGIAG